MNPSTWSENRTRADLTIRISACDDIGRDTTYNIDIGVVSLLTRVLRSEYRHHR